MKKDRRILVVVYFMVPMFIMTMFLPILVNIQQMELANQNEKNVLLFQRVIQRKMGLMTPVSTSDAVHVDYDAVMEVLDDIPVAYLIKDTATGSAATISKLQSFLSGTDRAHIAAHGSWTSGYSVVDLYGTDLKYSVVHLWGNQGLRCKVLVLSACNSMGHDGTQSNTLAAEIIAKSGILQVIGYKDVVDAGGAAIYAGIFWQQHLWANGASGGVSSDDAYDAAKNSLLEVVENQAIEMLWVALLTGIIIGVIGTVLEGLGFPGLQVSIFLLVLTHLFISTSYTAYCNSINSAHDNVFKYGTCVAGLTYSGGGGGGGDEID